MAKYTTEVRSICETLCGYEESKGYNDLDATILQATPLIFNFDYPIFDEAYRIPLEKKIIESYYTREIALETVGLWRTFLQRKMRQIMPYYNQLYKSTLLEFNPLYDTDSHHSRTITNNGTKGTKGTTIQGTLKKETGTVGNTDTLTNTGTVKNVGTTTNTGTVKDGGTVADTGTVSDNSTVTNNLTDTVSATDKLTTTIDTQNKDAYSDTPQGGLTGVADDTYLTNYRQIGNTGSTVEDTTKTDTTTKTGTVGEIGTKTNNLTKTIDTTKTNDLTQAVDNTLTNNLTHQHDSTLTNNLTTDIDDTTDVDTTDTINNTETYIETVAGKQGGENYSDMLLKFRKTFLNIDMQIIDDLSELFFTLW
jgi:hypothetical protein